MRPRMDLRIGPGRKNYNPLPRTLQCGFLILSLKVETRDLSSVDSPGESPLTSETSTLRFNYHGVGVAGMFGLVGAVTQLL